MHLDRLRAFACFAEHLSFTHAARALHLSQPALHGQVGRLADDLAVPLYRRRGRSLILTAEGREVAAFARELTDRVEGFRAELAGVGSRRPVVIAAGEGAYRYLLGPAIRAFIATAKAPLRLITADRDGALDAVRDGTAHVAVTAGELDAGDLQVDTLAEVGQVLVAPRDHGLAARRTIRLADLEGSRLVVPPPGRPHRQTIADALGAASVDWEVAVEANGWDLMMHFVSLGLGLALVNACCQVPPGLVARPVPELPSRRYWIVRRRHLAARGAPGALVAVLRSHAR